MRKIFALVALASAVLCSSASAVPTCLYDPATGNLTLTNDALSAALYFDSVSGNAYSPDTTKFTNAGVPGSTTFDTADLPRGFTYLNLPAGVFTPGNVVVPQTPVADLILGSYANGLTAPPVMGTITVVPEPATLALVGCIGLVGLAIRRRS